MALYKLNGKWRLKEEFYLGGIGYEFQVDEILGDFS